MKFTYRIVVLFVLLLTSVIRAEEVVDRIVAQVGSEPVLETELLQAAYLEAQNSGIDVMQDEQKLDSLKRQVLGSIVDFRKLLEAARKDTSIKISEVDVRRKADDDLQRLLRQTGGETQLQERFGTTIRKIRQNLQENSRNSMLVQSYTEARLRDVRVTRSEVEKFWKDHQSEFPKLPSQIRLANILIAAKPSSSARSTALQLAESVMKRARSGEDFAKLAHEYSSDSLSAKNGGDLGSASRGTFLPEFEAAAFALTEGETSAPVETVYGFHLIQLTEKRGNKFHCSHILFSLQPTLDDSLRAKTLADSIKTALQSKASFSELAKQYSQDTETSKNGGDMGWYETSQMPPQFLSKVRTLISGEWTGPFDFKGGYHFLKVVDRKSERLPDLAEDWERIEKIALSQAKSDRYRQLVETASKGVFVSIRK